jgi:hypothetical protein
MVGFDVVFAGPTTSTSITAMQSAVTMVAVEMMRIRFMQRRKKKKQKHWIQKKSFKSWCLTRFMKLRVRKVMVVFWFLWFFFFFLLSVFVFDAEVFVTNPLEAIVGFQKVVQLEMDHGNPTAW